MCSCFFKNQLWLVIGAALFFFHSASGDKVQYVTPSQSAQSQNNESINPLTWSTLAANVSDLLDPNTTLIFLEGNHTLETDLVLKNLVNLLIQTTNASVTANVTCSSGVNLKFINITQLKISSLKFISCSSTIELVDQFTLMDSSFHGGSISSALQLIQTNTNIVRSSFTSCTVGSLSHLSLPVYHTFDYFGHITDFSYHSFTGRVGGALAIVSSNIEIRSSHFVSNEAEVGGAIYSQTRNNITIDNCTFVNNKASCSDKVCSGGALFIGTGCTARATNNTFLNNTSEYSGGAIALLHGSLFGFQNVFTGSQAQHFGGGIYAANSSTLELVKSNFSNNTAGENGGALFISRSLVYINSSSFNRSWATVAGGVAYVYSSNITVYNSAFNNEASQSGGVVSVFNSSITVYNCSFNKNQASDGGVVYATSSSSIIVHNSSFYNNEASQWGGGVFATSNSSITVYNSSFDCNEASRGGVVYAISSSSITVYTSSFNNNEANRWGGGVFATSNSSITVYNSSFNNNDASQLGGVVYAEFSSSITVYNSSFNNNDASHLGGVVYAEFSSSITVYNSFFNNNDASQLGGVVYAEYSSSITVYNSSFNNNEANQLGGVMYAEYSSSITVHNSYFESNEAGHLGGVVTAIFSSSITVYNSSFNSNKASQFGGVFATYSSSITVYYSSFNNNEARLSGGVMHAEYSSSITVHKSSFNNNEASKSGGVMYAEYSTSITLNNSSFNKNQASEWGGVVYAFHSTSITVYNSSFNNNEASQLGGVVYTDHNSKITVYSSSFNNNKADFNGGAIYASSSSVHLYTSIYLNNVQMTKNRVIENGGAIYLSRTSLYISGDNSTIFGNLANNGGAIYANESTLVLEASSQTTIAGNRAYNNGGGWYLTMSELKVKGSGTIITSNRANRTGGGLHADNSSIVLEGMVYFINNEAENGAGIGLEKNAILMGVSAENVSTINLTSNKAFRHGGALYVDDENNIYTCAAVNVQAVTSKHQCFSNFVFFNFSNNSAGVSGSNLFGGFLDRCKVNGQSQGENASVSPGLDSFLRASNIRDSQLDTISSYPVRLCFCKGGYSDCDYQPDTIQVNYGGLFSLQLIAYDQVHTPVESTIYSSFNSSARGLIMSHDQDTQKINKHCTKVNFGLSLFSVLSLVELKLSVGGPCSVSAYSERKIIIEVTCTCPIGFQISIDSEGSCNCICDSVLKSYVRTQCNSTTETIIKRDNFWITYTNYSHSSGYVIHPYCPYDYCHPPEENVHINLNIPNGADAQCASHRSGTLCGSCKPGFSVSLGSSACLHCPPNWPGLLVTIIIIFILSGIGLVALILLLNLTVAIGTLNAIIFYANMVAANKSALFTTSKLSFASVFVSWLNFDVGFDTCFFNGMDTYTKTWLQLAFPAYIFLLVAVIIRLSYHFKFFGNLIGKKDPVATLATLILLSYAKLLQTILTAFSLVILIYPNNSKVSVWLPDATVGYLSLKHAVLFTAAILILMAGLVYTFLLFTWQWFLCCRRKRVKWITCQKLSSFFEKYHIPYTPKHRYWTGLLLLIRVIVYLISAFNPSSDPKVTLLSTGVIMTCLFLYIATFSVRLYKTWTTNTGEAIAYFNITAVSLITLYMFESEKKKQILITNISVSITFSHLLVIVCCHTFRFANFKLYTKVFNTPFFKKTLKKLTQQMKRKVHFECTPLPADDDIHQFHELLEVIDRPVNTNDYKIPQVCNKDKPTEPTKSVVEPPKPLLEQPPPGLEEIKQEEEQEQQLSGNDCKKVGGHSATTTDKMQSSNNASGLEIPECDGCLSKSIVEPPKLYLDPTTPLENSEKIKHEQTLSDKDGKMKVEESHTISINERKQSINSYSGINMSLCYDDVYPSSSKTEIECNEINITPKPRDDDEMEVIVEVHVDSQMAEDNIDAIEMDPTNRKDPHKLPPSDQPQ